VFTQDAVIGGRVSGTVVAESRLELQSTSSVDGEIRARAEHLLLQEGARFSGQIEMIDAEPASQSSASNPAIPPAIP
jgi:cytoskeletal protein CcmA (bactofilin family)